MAKRTGYISGETKDAVRSILEATVEQNRWANLGVSQDHPDNTIDVFDKNEIDMVIERLPEMFHSSPVQIYLVEASFDIIATIKLDNKTGSIINAEPNGSVHDFDNSYTEIMEEAEKKLGKPIGGYKPFSNAEPKGVGD